MKRLNGLYIFTIIITLIGILFYFFPPESISYPDKKMIGLSIFCAGIVNLFFVYFFSNSKSISIYSQRYVKFLDTLLIIAFFFCIIGFMGLFKQINWYDTWTHFLVPFLGAFFVYMIFFGIKLEKQFSFSVILFFSLGMIGLIFFWEFIEVAVEHFTGYSLWLTNGDPKDFRDDVLAGFLGIAAGTVASVYMVKPLLVKLKK
ncbi:MAG: hypothetical protein ABH835_02105 [Patescibacteria group bacterium]